MEIRLVKTFVRSLKLERVSNEETCEEKLKLGTLYRDDCETEFVVVYDVTAPMSPGDFALHLQYASLFRTTEPITDDFKKSKFPRVNAAAVGYPYVRAFVSQFSVLSGYDVYILPVKNFVRAEEQKEIPKLPLSNEEGQTLKLPPESFTSPD